jgi:hypothetical protein
MIGALFGPHHITFDGDVAVWITAVATIGLLLVAVFALQQLGEIKRDRDVQIMVAMGRRWEAAEMTEALQNSRDYTPHDLAALVEAARTGPKGDEARAAAEKKLIVLLRVPNYFEDAALIARKGRMDPDLIEDYFGGVAVDEWSTWELAVKKLQEKDERAYEEFERLAREDRAAEARGEPVRLEDTT